MCKKCEKSCHCYDCVEKINKCNQLCQSKGYKMEKLKLYTVTKPNSDHSIKVGDIIWLSQNGDLNNATAKGWLQSNEWDIKGCNDFETTECTTHRLEICEVDEKVIKL